MIIALFHRSSQADLFFLISETVESAVQGYRKPPEGSDPYPVLVQAHASMTPPPPRTQTQN
jgi:hypothetical protein